MQRTSLKSIVSLVWKYFQVKCNNVHILIFILITIFTANSFSVIFVISSYLLLHISLCGPIFKFLTFRVKLEVRLLHWSPRLPSWKTDLSFSFFSPFFCFWRGPVNHVLYTSGRGFTASPHSGRRAWWENMMWFYFSGSERQTLRWRHKGQRKYGYVRQGEVAIQTWWGERHKGSGGYDTTHADNAGKEKKPKTCINNNTSKYTSVNLSISTWFHQLLIVQLDISLL